MENFTLLFFILLQSCFFAADLNLFSCVFARLLHFHERISFIFDRQGFSNVQQTLFVELLLDQHLILLVCLNQLLLIYNGF